MKYLVYILSGIIFSFGLLLSEMASPEKVKAFLELGAERWSPALLFVLFPASAVYFLAFLFLRKKGKSFVGKKFAHPTPRPIDRKLLIGSIIFGIGWGLSGICPGPALVHLMYPEPGFLVFIATMFLGFEIQRKVVL